MGKSRENYNAAATAAQRVRLTLPADCAGLRLDQALARLFPDYSRNRLARWVRDGQIRIDGRVLAPRHKVGGGEVIELDPVPHEEALAHRGENIPLDAVHEDGSLLVLNKPAGLVVHPGSGNWRGTLLNALLHHVPALADVPRAGIVHRLDKDTSGLLVVAKTLAAHADLVRQLQARSVTREYLAVVHG
ncbi:MAG: pseudouridine synthase, partial [Burkholderiales bacterium]